MTELITSVISNPYQFGRVKYLRLLSHQRHIANYLGCLFSEETVVGYTVFRRGYRQLQPLQIHRTIASYLQESDEIPGFLIDLGDTYAVEYNRHRRELFVCGFCVRGEFDDADADQIQSYIDLIPRNKALPPVPPGIHYELILQFPNDEWSTKDTKSTKKLFRMRSSSSEMCFWVRRQPQMQSMHQDAS